ncbi:MAG: hypothetical protein KAU14_06215 [Thermoplasmata archaeon]|nr:hypothetical protein [Thermoplasmata archaeon]
MRVNYTIQMFLAIASILVIMMIAVTIAGPSVQAQQSGYPSEGPDIRITGIEFSEDKPEENTEVTIYATVENAGDVQMDNITVVVNISGDIIGETIGLSLAANESRTLEYVWTTESGGHKVSAYATVDGIVISTSANSEVLSVNVGNVSTPLFALIFVAVVVVVMAVAPSVLTVFRK